MLDRNYILKQAKKMMMQYGELPPLIFVISEERPYILPVLSPQWDEGTRMRSQVLFMLGREFAQEQCLTAEMLKSIYLVHEFWVVEREMEQAENDVIPDDLSTCPDRKECVGLLELVVDQSTKKAEQTFLRSDIIRHGDIIDLGPCVVMDEAKSGLLISFLGGVLSAKYNDEEFDQINQRIAEVGEI